MDLQLGFFGKNFVRAKHRRGLVLMGVFLLIALGFWGVVYALSQNLVFFYTPTELLTKAAGGGAQAQGVVRLSGRVVRGSVIRREHSVLMSVMDSQNQMSVLVSGVLPRLFCEGQNVVLEGIWDLQKHIFKAHRVLIKHDEIYKCA